jgi:hypothetical protein
MTRYRCKGCQGEYDDVGADGVAYFHTCPPLIHRLVRRNGRILTLAPDDVRPGDEPFGDKPVNRPIHRDENTARIGGDLEASPLTPSGVRAIKSTGEGSAPIRD